MKAKISGHEWDINEVVTNDSMLLVDGDRKAGTAHFFHQKIFVDNSLSRDSFYRILCHELAHAFLFETQVKDIDTFDEEDVCNFTGMFAKEIISIANEYMEGRREDD